MPEENDIRFDLAQAVDAILGDVDEAHYIAQQHEGYVIADIIHAIVHRREGDYTNSIYWWNRVGDKIPRIIADVYPKSDPADFVMLARSVGRSDPGVNAVELAEIEALRSLVDSLSTAPLP